MHSGSYGKLTITFHLGIVAGTTIMNFALQFWLDNAK